MLSKDFADHFANDWIDSWNSHDLERILAHYTDDFVMSSPRIADIANEPSGILQGKVLVAAYWKRALELSPTLRFELIRVYVGSDSLIIHYNGTRGAAAEAFFFDQSGLVKRAAANY